MSNRLKKGCLAVLFFVTLAGQAQTSGGQADLQLPVPPNGTAKSAPIDLTLAEELVVEVIGNGPREALVAVYVHDETGTLICRDDPEQVIDAFTCRAPAVGRFHVIVHNTTDVPAVVRISRRGARGVQTTVPQFATLRVFFATDRQPTKGTSERFFGRETAG